MSFSLEELEAAFKNAVRKRRDAQAAVERAGREAQAAVDEVHALRVLARNYFKVELAEQPPEGPDINAQAEAVRQAITEESVAEAIAAHFDRHPEAATPSEVAEAIQRDTGRSIAAATITTTRARNLNIFEMATDSGKRGAFRLKKDSPPSMFDKDEEGQR